MFRLQKSRKIFQYTAFGAALALTGCAAGRYDVSELKNALRPAFFPLARPLDGPVVTAFGTRENGVVSKGVWIEGRPGDAVKAAADGRAAWIDERMEGYGRTLIIEHAGGFWTVYARMAEITARPGQRLRSGDSVGRLDAQNKRLYFEFRRGDRAEDPAPSWV